MKIKKLQLKNKYKRFFDLTIDLGDSPKKIIALVGPNGCGKSSVLDGMLFHHNVHQSIGNKGNKNSDYHSMDKTPNYSHENVVIDFIDGKYQTIRDQKIKSGNENTIFSFRSPYRYNSNLKVKESRATSEIRLNNYGATSAADLDDKMEENYRRLYIKYNRYLNDTEDCTVKQAKKKIIGDLNSSIGKCLGLEVSSIGSIEANEGTLYFKKTDHPNEFEFNVLSSGEKEVIDILLDLYLRQDEYCDTVFLLDEPELHINTSIQKNLLLEIDRLVGNNCQIWIATHSIGFLRTLQEDLKEKCQVIQFKESDNLAAKICTKIPMVTSRENWKEIFAVAIDDLTHLVCPKQIIYCEGKDKPGESGKEKGLDAQVFNKIFSDKYPDTLFVSSGGNTELDQRSAIAIAILSKAITALEVMVLKDRDMASGKKTTEADRKQYLKEHHNHRILKRWEIENYLFDKEVLQKYCNVNGYKFLEEDYDNLVKNINDQDLKKATGKIKNICGIQTSINADKFKIILAEHIVEGMVVYEELKSCIFSN